MGYVCGFFLLILAVVLYELIPLLITILFFDLFNRKKRNRKKTSEGNDEV